MIEWVFISHNTDGYCPEVGILVQVNEINPENINFTLALRFHQRLIQSWFSHVVGGSFEPIEIIWRLGVASIFLLFSSTN